MKIFLFPEKPLLRAALVLMTTFMSCTTVFFDHPQPVNSKNIETIPEEIRGKWTEISNHQAETITIDQSSFKKVTDSFNHVHKSNADSGHFRIADGKLYLLSEDFKKGNSFRLENDTIYYTEHSEVVFTLSDSVLLRRAKNCFVLNTRKNNWWEIFFISKNKNG